MRGWPVAGLLVIAAIVCLVLAWFYYQGDIQFLTTSGTSHAHHVTHAVALVILAVLCLVGANLARPKPA